MYGLDYFISPPPLSILLSILLILSCDALGLFVIKRINGEPKIIKLFRLQSPIIGATFISFIIYNLAIAGFAKLIILKIIAIILLCFSFLNIFFLFNRFIFFQSFKKNWSKKYFGIKFIIIFFIFSYFLYALSPITNIDSLDYHVGVAINILINGSLPTSPEWFHSRLAGNGEALNALGLSIGAEQFGSLLQFSGLIGILGLIYNSNIFLGKKNINLNRKWTLQLMLIAVSTPVLIFLIGSSKHQLLPISMTSCALMISVYILKININKKFVTCKLFFLICVLLMVASQTKFNFLLSGGLIGIFSFYTMVTRKMLIQGILITTFASVLILFPPILWKAYNFHGGIIETLFTPFPGDWHGTKDFEINLRNYKDSQLIFPLSLLIPSKLGVLSTIIGFGVVILLFIKINLKDNSKYIIILSFLFISIAILFGLKTSRSYLEPYFWLLILFANQNIPRFFFKNIQIFNVSLAIQIILSISMCWYGIFSFMPSFFSAEKRNSVMNNLAEGYTLMNWIDKSVPKDAVILSEHRALGISKRKSISLDWMKHSELDKNKILPYLKIIKNKKPTHLVLISKSNKTPNYYNFYSGCLLSEPLKSDPINIANRNPFNRGSKYTAWIFLFNSNLLPDCIKDNTN